MAFGIALSVRSRVRTCTPALFDQVVDGEQTARVCAEIKDALEKVKRGEMCREDFETFKAEQKKRLAIFTPHATFPKGRRVNEDAVPSGLSMYDVDHISLTPGPSIPSEARPPVAFPRGERSIYQRLVEHTLAKEPITDEGMIAELKRLGICLVHVTPSTEGFRLFFKIPEHLYTPFSMGEGQEVRLLEEAQRWMSEQLGDEHYDGCVKDLARCSFVVPRGYILYLDEEELFIDHLPLTIDHSSSAIEHSSSAIDHSPLTVEHSSSTIEHSSDVPTNGQSSMVNVQSFKGIPYSSIISEWFRRTGGEPQSGERNVKLHKLAVNLRAICDNRKDLLLSIMPRFGLSETELKSIIDSACKEEPKGVSKMMTSIIDHLTLTIDHEDEDWDDGTDNGQSSMVNVQWNKLPLGLKESLIGVPASMHMPVLCSVLPIAAAYADQVEVEYCDGMRQRLGLMSIIRGEQASGKSVCKNAVDVWKRQFDEEDALARKREEEWKERKKGRKANEKAPEDPKVLIRMVPVTVSCSTLLKRFKNSNGHTLYSFGEELDTLRKTNGAGSWSSKYDIYRLSFDQGEWGQDYNSDQAESGVVKVAYNWTMLGTDGALRKCFKSDNIENGLSSRILVAEMPDSSFAKMPKFARRSAEDEARIQDAVTRLRSYSGFVDTPRLRKAIETWVEEKRVEAAKDIDRVKDIYRKRAAVIGFRCGVIHHLLSLTSNQTKPSTHLSRRRGAGSESKASLDFALMMADYTLQQQIAAFGEALEGQFTDARSECQRYGSNHSVFDQLPPTFSMGDLRALKRGLCGEAALRKIISRWYRDHWIEKTDKAHWRKLSVENGTLASPK